MDAKHTELIDQALDMLLGDLRVAHESSNKDFAFPEEDECDEDYTPDIIDGEISELLKVARERRLRRSGKQASIGDPFDLDSLDGMRAPAHGTEWLENIGFDFSEGEDYEIPLNDIAQEQMPLKQSDHRSSTKSMNHPRIEATALTDLFRAAM